VGISADYAAKKLTESELPQAILSMRQGQWDGFSVTLPFKETILEHLDEIDVNASMMGAVNCIKRVGNRVKGYNTDAFGFEMALKHAGIKLRGAQVLMLGSGGAARACAFAAINNGAGRILIANRTLERAQLLVESLSSRIEWDMDVQALELGPSLASVMRDVDVVVNATPLGSGLLGVDPLPKECLLSKRHHVFDLVYHPMKTPLLERAEEAQAHLIDGLWMLVFQAFEQFRIWTGKELPSAIAPKLHGILQGEG
jgi:shikimate dehydrogenase